MPHPAEWNLQEKTHIIEQFRFDSGQTLAELSLRCITLGAPVRDAAGAVTNAANAIANATDNPPLARQALRQRRRLSSLRAMDRSLRSFCRNVATCRSGAFSRRKDSSKFFMIDASLTEFGL